MICNVPDSSGNFCGGEIVPIHSFEEGIEVVDDVCQKCNHNHSMVAIEFTNSPLHLELFGIDLN